MTILEHVSNQSITNYAAAIGIRVMAFFCHIYIYLSVGFMTVNKTDSSP